MCKRRSMESIKFIASVEEGQIKAIKEIAKNLEDLGCRINRIHSLTGLISGSTQPGISLKRLKIKGIKHIEPDRDVGLYNV